MRRGVRLAGPDAAAAVARSALVSAALAAAALAQAAPLAASPADEPARPAPSVAAESVASAAELATLEAVMAGMAGARGVVAEFREVKELALLSAPLESRGVLHFVPPDRLLRRTLEPLRSELLVDGSRVVFRDAAGAAPVDLSGDPSARQFVDNVTILFRGDLAALRERYEVAFEASPPRWRLALTPRDPVVRRFVASLTLEGEAKALREMVLLERDGDRTTTRFERVDTDHAHTPEEIRALFGEPAGASGGPAAAP